MKIRVPVAAAAVLSALVGVQPLRAVDDATLLRLFLHDGTSLVSYGEFARVADRVIFSLPTTATINPPLQLINIAAERVDWERTNRYADAARAARYIATRAESDYVALSNAVSKALNDVAFVSDPIRRVAIAEDARKTLAEWPRNHFNYRLGEVRQLLSLLDEAIADLRASTGGPLELSLVALADPPAPTEPLLPPPTSLEAIDGLVAAAKVTESPIERRSLLSVALVRLDREEASLPRAWSAAVRANAKAALDADVRVDRVYRQMIRRISARAAERARYADVRGIQRVIERLHRTDAALGHQRPDEVSAALADVEARLDAVRRLRLSRDRWALRAPLLRQYSVSMAAPLSMFRRLEMPLSDIKDLVGSTEGALAFIQRETARVSTLLEKITPPEECRSAHAVLASAAHLASSAASIRREATLAGDVKRAWDASSAAAGARMLGARATMEIRALTRRPELP